MNLANCPNCGQYMNKVTLLPASAGQGWLCKACGMTIRPEEISRPDQQPPDGFKGIVKNQ